MEKILYIVRGLPGAGKSTLATKLCGPLSVFSADDYFVDDNYEYHFDANKLNEAHEYCYNWVEKAMQENVPSIAAANTFTKLDYMHGYKKLAERYGYKTIEVTVKSDFKSIHNVPDAVIAKMYKEFEPSKEAVLEFVGRQKLDDELLDIYECSLCHHQVAEDAHTYVDDMMCNYCSYCGAKFSRIKEYNL